MVGGWVCGGGGSAGGSNMSSSSSGSGTEPGLNASREKMLLGIIVN